MQKNKKINVLVFPCGSEIGLEINRAFKGIKYVTLFGGSSVDDHGKFVYSNYIGNIPYLNDANFVEKINKIITKYKIDYIFPAYDDAIIKFAENKIDCTVISAPLKTCLVARSKKKTYKQLFGKIKVPKMYSKKDIDIIKRYPVFLKPDIGQGSQDTFLIKNKKDLLYNIKKNPGLLILEYLPGKEYTVDCFSDYKGNLKFYGARERRRIRKGISVNTINIKNNHKIKKIAETINKNFKFDGHWFFQIKEDKNKELTLLEFAPRVSGSMALYRNKGVNFAVLSLYNKLKMDVNIHVNDFDIEMDRALCNLYKLNIDYKYVYIDFDDCILINNKINVEAIKFIFQAVNNKKKIVLITRNNKSIHDKLKKLRIHNIFDEIIFIENRFVKKSKFIKSKNSIFIDDSFAERMEVYKNKKIPVFSVDAIESLLKN